MTQTPDQIRSQIRTTLIARLGLIRGMGNDGFVRMTSCGAAVRDGCNTLTGLENATVHPTRCGGPVRNRAGDYANWMTVPQAKAIAIPAIEKALDTLDELFTAA